MKKISFLALSLAVAASANAQLDTLGASAGYSVRVKYGALSEAVLRHVNAYIACRQLDDPEFTSSHYLVFATRNGIIKKTSLTEYGVDCVEVALQFLYGKAGKSAQTHVYDSLSLHIGEI